VAALALGYRRRLNVVYQRVQRASQAVVIGLNALHSGRVGDYVLWLMAGIIMLVVCPALAAS
jgi:hypothetical protein